MQVINPAYRIKITRCSMRESTMAGILSIHRVARAMSSSEIGKGSRDNCGRQKTTKKLNKQRNTETKKQRKKTHT